MFFKERIKLNHNICMILVFLSFFIVFQEFREYRTDVDNLITEKNDMGESFLSESLNDSEMAGLSDRSSQKVHVIHVYIDA